MFQHCPGRPTHLVKRTLDPDVIVPASYDLRGFPGDGGIGHDTQAVNVVDGENGGGDEPRHTKHGHDEEEDGDDEQIEMVAESFLYFPGRRRIEKCHLIEEEILFLYTIKSFDTMIIPSS